MCCPQAISIRQPVLNQRKDMSMQPRDRNPNDLKTTQDKSEISKDGLRYKSKAGGSSFGTSSSMQTMSCISCGQHRLRSFGVFRVMAGMRQFVCGGCTELYAQSKLKANEKMNKK
jgi:hypothetical protein